MSLLSIIGTSTQSLFNTETQIAIISENIGNSQNPNYVQQDASIVDNGSPAGVVDVSRQINAALQSELYGQNATSAGQGYLSQIFQQLEQLDGAASGTPILTTAMQNLVSALQSFQAQPESPSAQAGVTQAAEGLASAVQTLSNGIETIAGQVQTQTQSDVSSLNSDLTQIAQYNSQIAADQASGKSTADLENARDALVSQVSSLVPVVTTQNADGTLRVATPSGVSLVSGTTAAQFTYTPYTLGANGVAGTDATISLSDQPGVDISGSFTSGKIGTELNILRVDDAGANSSDPSVAPLEKARRQLDAFVDQFYSSNPATPTAFQAAYNNAPTGASTDLAANLFIVQNQGPGGQPQPAGGDRFGFEVNPAIVNGTATLKQSSATPLVQALTQNSSTSPISAGGIANFSGTLASLAEAIASDQTQRADAAQNNAQASGAQQSATQTAYANSTGVSMDQQLADLIVLQNTYNASAKVVASTNDLAQSLMNLVQQVIA